MARGRRACQVAQERFVEAGDFMDTDLMTDMER